LIKDGQLATIDRAAVPNLKNISADFRDLVYDPGNKYSVPYNWGTAGLLVRTDLITPAVTRWADLWNPQIKGKIALYRGQPRETIALTLRALGYSANTENPAELEAALNKLLELKPRVVFPESRGEVGCAPLLIEGEVGVAMGYAYDVRESRDSVADVDYVLPTDGALLWGENFVIPANSSRRHTAEVFLNFLMRPDVNAQIANENFYATANEAAKKYIKAEIRTDPVIFPPAEDLKNAEIILPLSPAGQKLYDDIWARFLAAGE
jgi:spermidine/putrescine transport system substrate-binding protein